MYLNNVLTSCPITPYSPIILDLWGIEIRWYAVLILSGAVAALILGIFEGKKIGIKREFLEDLVLYGIPISVVGARIWYVAFEWNQFKDNPLSIIGFTGNSNQPFALSGLAIHGALAAAVIWGWIFCKKRGVSFLKSVDLAAPGFLIAQAMGRWGNFMNQEAHGGVVPGVGLEEQRAFLEKMGIPDFITNQMCIDGNYYHPTFLYESLWNLVGLIIILVLRRVKFLYIGDLGLFYLIWYSIGRFFIEGMRTDSLYIGNTGIRTAQLTSIILFLIGLFLFILRRVTKWKPIYYMDVLKENKAQ